MKRRTALKLTAAASLTGAFAGTTAFAADPIKIGAVAPKTGPLAGGAVVTHWPNIRLWATQVNARGGLMVDGAARPVEIIEYDDQTNPGETIKAVQRLATQDAADFIIAPYGTGLNIASAPIFPATATRRSRFPRSPIRSQTCRRSFRACSSPLARPPRLWRTW